MNKKEYEEKLEELERQSAILEMQIAELKQAKIEEPKQKRWKLKPCEEYWYISQCGGISWTYWYNNEADNWRYLTNNVFETKEEAEEYKKKLTIQAKFKNYVEEHNEELNWNNEDKTNYYLVYDFVRDKIYINIHRYCKIQGVIYASSEQILINAIKEIGKENVKKYVLDF